MAMSLDSYVGGPNQSVENPLGEGGHALHNWAFAVSTFRKMHGMEGGTTGPDEIVAESLQNIGATIMGHHIFGGGQVHGATIAGRDGGETIRPFTRRFSSSHITRGSLSKCREGRRSTSSRNQCTTSIAGRAKRLWAPSSPPPV
jgi:hypothetical protein